MSPATLQRALRGEGLTFSDAVRAERLKRAAVLLKAEPDIKVEVLSLCVGWRSRRSLYQAVKRAGMTLSEWRVEVLATRNADLAKLGIRDAMLQPD